MKRKYQMTGCARMLIFLLFFLPLLYIGISYYQGNDPLAKISSLFGESQKKEQLITKERFGIDEDAYTKTIKNKDREIEDLRDRIDQLEQELKKHNH